MSLRYTELTRRLVLASTAAVLATPSLVRAATTHEVQMLNQDPDNPRLRNIFLPRVLRVQPGDTLSFLSVDRGHNSAAIDGMVPEGGATWDGRINEDISVTLETPGFYGYQCTPHASAGMVGLVIVEGDGMMDNYEAAKEVRQRGRARNVFEEIWEEVAAMDLPA